MNKYSLIIRPIVISILLIPFIADAESSNLPQSGESVSGWTDNSRWAVDLSARTTWDADQEKASSQFVLGLDFHKVFSNRR